jgi:hypothetical protein
MPPALTNQDHERRRDRTIGVNSDVGTVPEPRTRSAAPHFPGRKSGGRREVSLAREENLKS